MLVKEKSGTAVKWKLKDISAPDCVEQRGGKILRITKVM